jgi:hypothetical protein
MVKLNRGGETSLSFNNPSTRRFRAPLIAGCTHAIVEYGTNDGINSGTQATNIINRLVVDRHLPEHPRDQGVGDDDPATHLLHRHVGHDRQPDRHLPHREPRHHQPGDPRPHQRPVDLPGVIDMEGACSSAQDSGKWGTSKTSDGVHPSDTVMRGAITTAVNAVVSTWSV